MRKIRFTALLLAAMLVTASCAGNGDGGDDTSKTPSTDTPPSVADELGLPEDLRFDGETFRLITAGGIMEPPASADDGDIVQQSIYKQMLDTSERLGVEFEFYNASPFDIASTWVYTAVNSWSDDYDAVFSVDTNVRTMADMGFFKTVNELPYINLDNAWWAKDYIEAVSLDPHDPYLLFGSITYNQAVERLVCTTFNKRLLREIHGLEDEDLYQMVLDGEWTIDKFIELSSGVYSDDGDGVVDKGDVHGLTSSAIGMFENLVYSSGLEFTGRDENDFPTLALNNEKTISLVEKLLALSKDIGYFNTKGIDSANDYIDKFKAGNALFAVTRFFNVWSLSDMSDDYGMLPMPKYDKDTEGYTSVVTTYVQWGAVPVTCERTEMTSAVLECLAYEGYEHVVPAYFENAIKLRYTRGDLGYETQMLDLITQGARTDFLYVNNLGGMGNIFNDVFKAGENIFASTYDSYEAAANTAIQKIIANAN